MEDKKMDEVVEQSFNDDELKDIMNEIENLEKEFVDESHDDSEHDEVDDSVKNDLQEEIDRDIAMASQDDDDEDHSETVVAMPKVSSKITPGEMSFSASGHMNFSMNFPVGAKTAKLCVDGKKGLVVELDGIELCISEDEGCTVHMAGGVKFNIPTSHKKAS